MQDEMFDNYVKNESTSILIAEILENIVKQSVNRIVSCSFSAIINLPARDPFVFWNIVFTNNKFFMTLFENYIVKLNFAIENKVEFQSAIISGELFNLMLKYLDECCLDRNVRVSIINALNL